MTSYNDYLNSEEYLSFLDKLDIALDKYANESKHLFESLPYEEKLKIFFHITKTIYNAELVENCTYRTVLYDKFGFDTDSYTIGMDSGFMYIHNSLYSYDDIIDGIKAVILALKHNQNYKISDLHAFFTRGYFRPVKNLMQLELNFGE